MVAQQDTVCNATGVTLEQLVNREDFFRRYASTKRGLYKIYFRRAITNLLDNWRVFTSSRERAQKTEKELLQYAKSRRLITPGMLFCHQMAQRGITKILTVPFKLYYKRNYYGKMLKRLQHADQTDPRFLRHGPFVRAGSSGNALSVGWLIFAPPLERPGPAARRTF